MSRKRGAIHYSSESVESETTLTAIEMVGFEPKIEVSKNLDRNSDRWRTHFRRDLLLDDARETEEVVLRTGWFPSHLNRNLAYGLAYQEVDRVQDFFPSSLTLRPLTLNFSALVSSYNYNLVERPILACERSTIGGRAWSIVDADRFSKSKCLRRFVVSASNYAEVLTTVQVGKLGLRSVTLFTNPLFFTSVFTTILLYSSILALVAARILKGLAFAQLQSIESAFERAPMTTAFSLLGILTALLTRWLG